MEEKRFAGYRIIKFSREGTRALQEVAERLFPNRQEILDRWVERQWNAWQPPGLTRADLAGVFDGLFETILQCMRSGELEPCLLDLEDAGRELARRQFPFQALLISIHFFEQSYLPFLLDPPPPAGSTHWLIPVDEFLHAALAAISNSYFEANQKALLDQVEVGRMVQEGLLANIPNKTADLEIAHIYISAQERARIGGDFLDFFRIYRTGAAFIIGDLSGHGLEAAADSLMLRSLFRGFMCEEPNLSHAMERVNRVLATELKPDQFATALAVAYDQSGRLSLVSAGHPYPILCDDRCRLLELSGSALAIDGAASYAVREVALPPGATFVAYTDGLIESGSVADQFGEERALAAVEFMRDASARGIAEYLIDNSLRHAGGRFTDDVAVLVLKRRNAALAPCPGM